MRCKFFAFFSFLILLLLLSYSVSAVYYQKKMTVNECLFSFNEVPDGNVVSFAPWDKDTQSGVFMKVKNDNLILGESEVPDYRYTYYQNNGMPRPFYNNFGYISGEESSLPILNVIDGNENTVYIKCSYVVGNYKVYFLDFYQSYWSDSNLKLTHDFNITKGIFEEGSSPEVLDFMGNSYSYSYGMFSRVDKPRFFDNGNFQGDSLSELKAQGFFPFSNPVVISSFNLRDVPPGFIRGYSLIREGGYRKLFDPFYSYMYVNSTHLTNPIVFPKLLGTETIVYDDSGVEVASFKNDCRLSNSCSFLDKNYSLKINYSFNNPYTFDITELKITKRFAPQYRSVGGMSHLLYISNISKRFKALPINRTYEYNIDFLSGETKSFIKYYTFDDSYAIPDSLIIASFTSSLGGVSEPFYHRIGSDCVDYFGFNRFNTYIELIRKDNRFQPVFRLDIELRFWNNMVEDTYCSNVLEPGDYSFRVDLENNTGNVKDSIYFPLDEAFFKDILGFDCSPNCNMLPNVQEDQYLYSISVPIKSEYIDIVNEGEDLFAKVYSVKENDPFKGKWIARTGGKPYFNPGNVVYAVNNVLRFNNLKRRDVGELWIFNPSFSSAVIELKISDLSDEENFTINYNKSFNLYPLQNKRVNIEVEAIHDKWNTDAVSPGSFILETKAFLTGPEGSMVQESNITYSLFLNPINVEYFDFRSNSIKPDLVGFNNPTKLKFQEVTLDWLIIASKDKLDEYDGMSYFVNYSLMDNESVVLKSDSLEYVLDKSKKYDSLSFTYYFNSSFDYVVVLNVDSENSLDEDNEDNNIDYFDFPMVIDLCYYNKGDNSQYYYDFFGNSHLDSSCKYFCCPSGTTCKDDVKPGFCAIGNSVGCDGRSIGNCNDFDKTKPYLCAYVEEEVVCKGCATLFDTCGAYDNEDTCEIDNCEKHRYDEMTVGRDGACSWDSTSNSCIFNSTDCDYDIEVIGSCDNSVSILLNYTSLDAGCWPKSVAISCPIVIRLPFFNWINVVLSIFAIFGIYCLYERKRFMKYWR